MAKKKKSFFGTLLKLGGLAAAGAVIYQKRGEIKEFLTDAAERMFPEEADTLAEDAIFEAEPDVVIDATAKAEPEEITKEDAPEA